jgi:type II secretory pathway component GspD/PulD (secretin)
MKGYFVAWLLFVSALTLLILHDDASAAVTVKAAVAPAKPAPVPEKFSLVFTSVKLNEFTRLVVSEVMQRGYVFSVDFAADQQLVSVDLRNTRKDAAEKLLRDLLDEHGYTVIDRVGFLKVVKRDAKEDKPEDVSPVFFYRPKFRSVSYITDLVGMLFDKGRFSFQRGIKSAAAPIPTPQPGQKQPQQGKGSGPLDSGTSAQSLIDKDQDAFIFEGSALEIAKLQKLLNQVDVPTGEVLVRAYVYEVATNAKEGTAFGLALNLLQGKLGLVLGGAQNLANSVSFKSASIDAIFSALSSDSRFKVVSSPSLRVQSGNTARFSVGSETPVLGAVSYPQNGQPVQSVEYRTAGVIMELKPQVRDSQIELAITQQISSFIPTTTGVNQSPTLLKREISTSVGLGSDDVVLLGGLDEEKTSSDSTGLSFLPSVLHSKGQEGSKTEIVLVLHVQKI